MASPTPRWLPEGGGGAQRGPGAAFWTFQTRPEGPRATWTLTVEGSQGTRATVAFYVEPPLSDAAPWHQ